MIILGIETSCDETAASVVEDGRNMLSNIVASQAETHAIYGGVVPEIASRAHTEAISSVTSRALEEAKLSISEIDALAVTCAPGLIGALLTGLSFAKGLAYAAQKPLVPVHHIKGHVAANYLVYKKLAPPFYALVVSGGHTSLLFVENYTKYRVISQTRDDAAGEAFDKAARVLGLPYPGGAALNRMAVLGDENAVKFTSATVQDNPYDFSFSGLKTSVINHVHKIKSGKGAKNVLQTEMDEKTKADIAASFTKALVHTIALRLDRLLKTEKALPVVLAGGVAANSHLRTAVEQICQAHGVSSYLPPLFLCGDNAAMIASQGFYEYEKGSVASLSQNACAAASFDDFFHSF